MTHLAESTAAPPVAVVTGGTRGIGLAVARELAHRGQHVVIVARDAERGQRVCAELAASGGSAVEFEQADLASIASTRSAALRIAGRHARLAVLINNAGVYSFARRTGDDDIEVTMAVNVIAPFVLSALLLPALRAGAPSRIVNISSRVEELSAGTLLHERAWRPRLRLFGLLPYARSKRMLMLLTREWSSRLAGSGVAINSVHPGFVATDLLRELPRWVRALYEPLLTTPGESARTIVGLALDPAWQGVTGRHFRAGPRQAMGSRGSRNAEVGARLWTQVARLAKVDPEQLPTRP